MEVSSRPFGLEVIRGVLQLLNLPIGCLVVIDETASEDVLKEVRETIKQTQPEVFFLTNIPSINFKVFRHSNTAENKTGR